ncbi:MAG: hypothetical protein RLZZ397_1355 [Pseudomonadota bacterium]|jgi:DNA-binding NarL/FixJ family response regulator
MIEMVLADGSPITLDGLQRVFEQDRDCLVSGAVLDGESLVDVLQRKQPDVVVMDIHLPKKSGLDVIRDLPQISARTKAVVFTSAPMADVVKCMDLGAQGLVGKDKSASTLRQCVQSVQNGNRWYDRELTLGSVQHLLDREKKNGKVAKLLTPRELAVAKMVAEGNPNKRIASKLNISEGTTKLHLHNIYQKTTCQGRMALMLFMKDQGFL